MFFSKSTQGFYAQEIHGINIPQDAVEISGEEYEALMQAQSEGKRIVFDAALGKPVAADQPLQSASAAIATKLASINAACEAEIAAISAGYPASEVLSWPKQETEARAWTADNQAVTPLLDSLAAARGISKAELASRVIVKADLFAQLSGAIIGKRQALEDQLDAISDGLTAEELEAPITPEVQAQLDSVQW
ncbi:hypothetical protein MTYP_01054 [Methylophilaceae bacterium]|nr:hypothetical protein MTYP_01054 [Methylophilaceae bacterium]